MEKAFNNFKDHLNMRRLSVFSGKSLKGYLFSNYTLQEVLDEFDIIEYFEVSGQKLQVGETTRRQLDLYVGFGVAPPTLLQ